jgi:hypothetical protein
VLAKLGDKVIVIVVSKTGIKNAEGGIRTPTGLMLSRFIAIS